MREPPVQFGVLVQDVLGGGLESVLARKEVGGDLLEQLVHPEPTPAGRLGQLLGLFLFDLEREGTLPLTPLVL